MKVTVLPENIINYIPLLTKILPTHTQVPILSNILIEATKGGLTLRATDLEMGAEIEIPAKIETEGSISVPGREFLETISSLPKDKIELEVERETLFLKCRDIKVSFNTISGAEFPKLFKSEGELIATFEKEEFLNIFSNLTFSVSQEETRPQLTGVYIDPSEGGVNFVSTDGYRMSLKKASGVKNANKEGLIVSVKLVNEVVALKIPDPVSLFLNKTENQIVFLVGGAKLIGRMIDGAFPDYERVLPKESKTTVVFDRESLLQVVRLASVFAKDSSNVATLQVEGNSLRVETKTQGVGEGNAVVECETDGDDVKIAFNIRYLMDVLKTISDKNITLKLNSGMDPALFEVKEKNFSHVIMPIQVDD